MIGTQRAGGPWTIAVFALLLIRAIAVHAEVSPDPVPEDRRVRVATYDRDQVYRLYGFVGYQIDLEFSPDERFIGLSAGDVDALGFAAKRNHLFIKPKAAIVATNITVLTTGRTYQFSYTARPLSRAIDRSRVTYAVRFRYPPNQPSTEEIARRLDERLDGRGKHRIANYDYWFCGNPSLKPISAWDDGVLTHLRFPAQAEMPAIFLANADGTESLVNFGIDHGSVLVQRVAARFVLRRGKLTGCIVNKSFRGIGHRLDSGTVATDVHRVLRGETNVRQ